MSCNIVINQQSPFPGSGGHAHEAKVKVPERQRRGKKSHERYMKKLRKMFLKDNQEVQMTLKELIDYFQQGLTDPASTLIATEETMRIMKKNTILK